ncbi:MAG: deoxyribodipyrimidine photo-lyase, partial [Myxococcota bacterium]
MGTQLVWLKRDLRVRDHAPLLEASLAGPVIVLYSYEPSLWRSDEMDGSHLRFINECLKELEGELQARGGRLVTRVGEVPEVFDRLLGEVPFERVWSHEETGNRLTFNRDRAVARWCKTRGVEWREIPQHGVFRPHPKRDGWAQRWRRRMDKPVANPPERIESPEVLPE